MCASVLKIELVNDEENLMVGYRYFLCRVTRMFLLFGVNRAQLLRCGTGSVTKVPIDR